MVDAMIRLFESTATVFDTNGIGVLPDATVCEVTEERNGSFELKMNYPINGVRYSELKMRRIIVAKSNPYSNPQAFRIYDITRPIKGIVTVYAEHISYDLSGIPVRPFEATSCGEALNGLKTHAAINCPFTFWTDKNTSGNFIMGVPFNLRSLLGGVEGSILDVYGTGEYEFDNYEVKFHLHRGTNRGVTLRYGKNITDLTQEENNANVYTGVYAYWYSEEEGLLTTNPEILNAEGTYNYQKIQMLDMSYDWVEKPTAAELKTAAEAYMKANDIGVPKVSIEVSFVHLSDSEEYGDIRDLETVHLCDTVTVIFEELGVNAESKCVKTVYNCLTDKYESVTLGESRTNLVDAVAGTDGIVNDKIEDQKTFLERAVDNATALITGNLGGYAVLHSSTGSEQPDEILIMDTPDIKTAKKIWRWNKSGLGYSSTGYNGPYGLAITADGSIVADYITTGHMNADIIKGGTLLLGGPNNGNGNFVVHNANGQVIGRWDNTGIYAEGDLVLTKKLSNVQYSARLGEVQYLKNGYSIVSELGLSINDSTYLTKSGLYGQKVMYIQPTFDMSQRDTMEYFDITMAAGPRNPPTGAQPGQMAYFALTHWNHNPNYPYSGTPLIQAIGGENLLRMDETKVYFRGDSGYGVYIYAQNQTTMSPNVTLAEETAGSYYFRFYRSASSSKRYKKDIVPMTDEDVEALYNIQPVFAKFKDEFITETDERYQVSHPMFIAEDMNQYFSVGVDHDQNGNPENWNIRILVPAMFQMIKSQKEEIKELRNEIEELKKIIKEGV